MTKQSNRQQLYFNIKNVLDQARRQTYQSVNFIMVDAYWKVGRLIAEEEQKGKARAEYGELLIEKLSLKLTKDFGNGYSPQSLWNMRQFYMTFPILSTLWRELSWSHYKLLIRVENKNARVFYAKEAMESRWSVRALERHAKFLEVILADSRPHTGSAEGCNNLFRF